MDTKQTQRLWQSSPPFLEYTMNLLNDWDDNPIRWDFCATYLLQLMAHEGSVDLPASALNTKHDKCNSDVLPGQPVAGRLSFQARTGALPCQTTCVSQILNSAYVPLYSRSLE